MSKLSKFKAAEVELVYHTKQDLRTVPKINSSDEAAQILHNIWNPDTIEMQEEGKVLLLNRCSRILGVYSAFKGGTTGCVIDIKLVFAAALKANASGIIFAHNHPSGNKNPSNADNKLTQKIHDAAKVLDIEFLDHLIITKHGHFSFADEGIMPA